MRKVLYTCIFGKQVDDLKVLKITTRGWEYVCLTNQSLDPVEGWTIIQVPTLPCGEVKSARFYKLNYREVIDADLYIYIDGSFACNISLDRWERNYYRPPFTTIRHPVDDCLFVEAVSCIRMGKGDSLSIMAQATDYARDNMPKSYGLISSGILTRAKDTKVEDFCYKWWKEVLCHSSRDQIAFSYVKWKERADWIYNTVWDYRVQREFFHIPHLYKNKDWREQKISELELAKPIV